MNKKQKAKIRKKIEMLEKKIDKIHGAPCKIYNYGISHARLLEDNGNDLTEGKSEIKIDDVNK